MIVNYKKKVAVITGAAGFIGFHIALRLLDAGWQVLGLDSMTDYYDVSLKKRRQEILQQYQGYQPVLAKLEQPNILNEIFESKRPEVVLHLAGQAGVRYSIEDPRSYLQSNVVGTFELLEAARNFPPKHMLLASTSSVYGANTIIPYSETQRADHQMSFYAATKKATEAMAHSYSHLFDIPITMLRFFTVYGPWGRPDMAIFKFTKAMLNGDKIDVYNGGNMLRDFTFIDDLVERIYMLLDEVPTKHDVIQKKEMDAAGISPVAPYRVLNIGNSKPEKLIDFIAALEKSLGIKAAKNLMDIQPGDVPITCADTHLLEAITGKVQATELSVGVDKFVKWYKDYYQI